MLWCSVSFLWTGPNFCRRLVWDSAQLYRLLRGTGIRGLRGIVEHDRFASGHIGRPLLDLTRTQILTLAQAWQLEWIDDPSNVDVRFDRNYLRYTVLPLLTQRSATLPDGFARSAHAPP